MASEPWTLSFVRHLVRNPTKVLIAGAVLAGLIAVGGAANTVRLEGRIKELEAACNEESKLEPTKDKLVCEADKLAQLRGLAGIQLQIVTSYRSLDGSKFWTYPLAILVFLLAAVPWAWYFFLRRVAELRDAIVGKRDQ